MLGFLQTIINCIDWIVDTIEQIIDNGINLIETVIALAGVIYESFNWLPVPVLVCAYICFQVMCTRFILTLGFRG